MIKLVNYNKGAAIITLRNIQVISMLYIFLGPPIFYIINEYLFKLPEYIISWIIVIIVSSGIVVHVTGSIVFLLSILVLEKPFDKFKGP